MILNNTFHGRFTTPDLLWSAFPAQTPYHYAYNSPLTYRDPTGLAPEKEKEREELMSNELAECGSQILARQKIEVDNGAVADSPQPESSNGARPADVGSAPNDLGDGGSGVGGSSSMLATRNCSQFAMFYSLLAQHLNVGPTGGPMISSGGGFGGGGYVDTKSTNAPKRWDAKSIDAALVNGGFYKTLNDISKTTSFEVGFFLRYDSQRSKIFADFFIGKSEVLWLDLNINPYQKGKISVNQMIIGFVHKQNVADYFSPQDGKAIRYFSLGKFPWTKIPSSIENQDAKIMDRLFFALLHPNGKDILSYNYMNSTTNLQTLYYKLRTKIYYNSVTIPNFNKTGFDYHNNIKK